MQGSRGDPGRGRTPGPGPRTLCQKVAEKLTLAQAATKRIEGDAEPIPVPIGEGLAKLGEAAIRGIVVIGAVLQRRVGCGQDVGRGGKVGVSDAQIDHVHPPGNRLILQANHLVHEIDRQVRHPFGLAGCSIHRRRSVVGFGFIGMQSRRIIMESLAVVKNLAAAQLE